ncbi:hypothetical protein HOY81_15275 [Streptomyces sp. JJ36]|nr:hypothetical protein [Streptomyces sp. JJ36]
MDADHADFLRRADGWPAILQDIDLFGTAEFGTTAYVEAEELVRVIEGEIDIRRGGSSRLIPIGASRTDVDILVMPCGSGSRESAPVIWLAGGEVERYGSFPDFFRGMIEHNLAEANALD